MWRKAICTNICGDTGVLVFWDPCSMCVFGVCIFDTDAHSMMGDTHKNGKYLEACPERKRNFTSLVLSVGGVMGEEIKELTKKLDDELSKKWYREY